MSDAHPPVRPPSMPDFTTEEYQRILQRNRFSMQMLTDRVAGLTLENVELMSIVQELQTDLAQARQTLADLKVSEDVLSTNGGVQVSPGLIMPQT